MALTILELAVSRVHVGSPIDCESVIVEICSVELQLFIFFRLGQNTSIISHCSLVAKIRQNCFIDILHSAYTVFKLM